MSYGASSVRTEEEFRQYFPNASHKSPSAYLRPEPLDTYRIVLIAAFSSLLIVGITANGWVARVVGLVLRQSRTEAPRAVQIFILALCFGDLVVLLFLSFLLADLWYGQWVFLSSFLCQSYLISESLSKFYAPFLLVELSGFCYLSVRRRRRNPVTIALSFVKRKFPKIANPTVAALAAVLVAFGSAFGLMTPVYQYSDVYFLVLYNGSDEGLEVSSVLAKCAFQPPDYVMTTFTVYSFICGYLIPACLFTFFYSALLIYVHRRRRKSSCSTLKSMDYFQKVAKTSCGLVVFYFASWTPYWTMVLYQYTSAAASSSASGGGEGGEEGGDGEEQAQQMSDAAVVLSYFIHMLPYVNCNAYPLLYTILNRSIQTDYLRACEQTRSMRQRRKESESFYSSVFRGSSFRSGGGASGASFRKLSDSVNLDNNLLMVNNNAGSNQLTAETLLNSASAAHRGSHRSTRSLSFLRPPSVVVRPRGASGSMSTSTTTATTRDRKSASVKLERFDDDECQLVGLVNK